MSMIKKMTSFRVVFELNLIVGWFLRDESQFANSF
jgi:hypothetical protein